MSKFVLTLEDGEHEGAEVCFLDLAVEEGKQEGDTIEATQAFLFAIAIKRLYVSGELGKMVPIICEDFVALPPEIDNVIAGEDEPELPFEEDNVLAINGNQTIDD